MTHIVQRNTRESSVKIGEIKRERSNFYSSCKVFLIVNTYNKNHLKNIACSISRTDHESFEVYVIEPKNIVKEPMLSSDVKF